MLLGTRTGHSPARVRPAEITAKVRRLAGRAARVGRLRGGARSRLHEGVPRNRSPRRIGFAGLGTAADGAACRVGDAVVEWSPIVLPWQIRIMSLNIKSAEAHELAAELARLTGESMTKAVTEAIRERLARERQKRDEDQLFAELMAIADQCAAHPLRDHRSLEEILYDERGLPR